MNIQNTQLPHAQPSIESLVGNQKQEFPKPSVPPEDTDYTKVQEDTEKTQNSNEPKQNDTGVPRDLSTRANEASNKDTLKIQEDVKESNIKASQQSAMDATKELKELQETLQKQKGAQTYMENMGINGVLS